MQDSESNIGEQVSYNMAGLLNVEISSNLSKANTEFTRSNFTQAFLYKMAAKNTAVHTFKPAERNQVKKLEDSFFKYQAFLNMENLKIENPKIYNKIRSILFSIYLKYNILVQDLLDRYGFLGERKKDASKLKGFD